MPIKLNGATNGSVELDVPAAVGSDLQITLPATAGTAIVKAADGSVDLGSVDINSAGRLGVGVTSPSSIFHLQDADNTVFTLGNSSYDNGVIQYYNGSLQLKTGSSSGDRLMTFSTAGTERMRLDSSGNLGIGRTPVGGAVGYPLQIRGTSFQSFIQFSTATQGDTLSDGFVVGSDNTNASIVQRENAHIMFATNDLERARIASDGDFMVGQTNGSAGTQGIVLNAAGQLTVCTTNQTSQIINHNSGSGNRGLILFRTDGTNRGSIHSNGSSTSYNTTSDYRLKENVVDIADGITRVKQLQPKRFNFIADDTITVDGFIAHEAQTVVPEAVTGEKDGEEMQGIDQAKLVPLLTAALQEAISKIETLETQVAALEATS